MDFRTQISIPKETTSPISYHSKVMLLGSCFSENMGKKLDFYKFQTMQNPFGILFHPKAIENFLESVAQEKIYSEKDLFFHNERWHSFEAHSSMSTSEKSTLLNRLNTSVKTSKKTLKETSHCIITLGTVWVYAFLETQKTVANCHKIPQKKFIKRLLSVAEIQQSLQQMIALLRAIHPTISIIFTVSPVRHLKDGFVENMQSKSHLITAIHQVKKTQKAEYFPSFEIMMDELRDYRFYADDMIHPNTTAIHFIWEKFVEVWIAETSKKTMLKIEEIQKGIFHKPFNENSEQHQQFLKNLAIKTAKIQQEFPHISFIENS